MLCSADMNLIISQGVVISLSLDFKFRKAAFNMKYSSHCFIHMYILVSCAHCCARSWGGDEGEDRAVKTMRGSERSTSLSVAPHRESQWALGTRPGMSSGGVEREEEGVGGTNSHEKVPALHQEEENGVITRCGRQCKMNLYKHTY